MEDKNINIIELINSFGIDVEKREKFLYEFRTFIKDVTEQYQNIVKVNLRTNVKDTFSSFGGNIEVMTETITNFARSIIDKGEDRRFSNLLISLISNYMNAIKFDSDKHIMLYYPDNAYWDNINAIPINDQGTIDAVCSIYVNANADELEKTVVAKGSTNIPVQNLKIKTINNYNKSIRAQKIADYRKMLVESCDNNGLKGAPRQKFINEKLATYKAEL